MFNLSNLNDHEFEILCKDIMQRKLNVDLRVFKQGQDGGIDIADVASNNAVIVQCKRYVKSTWTQLYSNLKKCKIAIDKIKPSQFYVCTSLELSPQEVDKIFDLLKEHMRNKNNILDGKLIDEFLQEAGSKDIVVKNYKLWLAASSVLKTINEQNIIIDGEVLIDEINKNHIFYVQTEFYQKAVRSIFEDKAILITGAPGVGKTTVSNMIALYLVGQEYSIIYSSGNNIVNIKKSISMDPTKRELIYLDDVLGQAYLDLKYDKISEINSLIAFVKKSKNKFLIMNSRITILKEAERRYDKFKESLERVGIKILDLDEMSSMDKARILKNHLYYNDVDHARLASIKSDKNYFKIIKHKNYNPRIIEFVTKPIHYNLYKAEEYFNFILGRLNNPEDVWRDELENRLQKEDRLFMYTLYSLGLNLVDIDVLKEAFENRIKVEIDVDTTKDVFSNVLKRMSDNLVRIVEKDGNSKGLLYNHSTIGVLERSGKINKNGLLQIGVTNPSINDYLRKFLNNNKCEIGKMLSTAVFVDQYTNLMKNFVGSNEFKELLQENRLWSLKHTWVSPGMYYLRYLKENSISDINNKKMIIQAISSELCRGIVLSFIPETIRTLFTKKFIIEHDILSEVLVEAHLDHVFDCLELEDTIKLIKTLYSALLAQKCSIQKVSKFIKYAETRLDFVIEDLIKFSNDDGLPATIREAISGTADSSHKSREEYIDSAESNAKNIIERESKQTLAEILPIKISADWIYDGKAIDFYRITQVEDLSEKIAKYIYDEEAADYYADQWREYRDDGIDEDILIDEIFNR